MKKLTYGFIGIIVLIVVVMGYLYTTHYLNQQKEPLTATSTTSTQPKVPEVSSTSTAPTTPKPSEVGEHPGMKLYRNDEFGFEFWYPEGWEIAENLFKSPYSKFNFAVVKIDGNRTNLFDSMNVVTQDFFENFLINMKSDNSEVSEVIFGSISGEQFRYNAIEDGVPVTDVTFPIGEYHAIFGVERKHEKELYQVLSTFKFLK